MANTEIKKLENGTYQVTCGSEKSLVFKCWSTAEFWAKAHRH